MKIIFVRHANPNYEADCLTELGRAQAALTAKRLTSSGIKRIYSSSCGRALETASYTARELGLKVIPCDFMREISWAPIEGEELPDGGEPWIATRRMIARNECIMREDWRELPTYKKSEILGCADVVAKGIDGWLSELGYTREGNYYRVGMPELKAVAMFCHAGSFSSAISHLFNLPLPFIFGAIPIYQAAIAEITLTSVEGTLITPRFATVNDKVHLDSLE